MKKENKTRRCDACLLFFEEGRLINGLCKTCQDNRRGKTVSVSELRLGDVVEMAGLSDERELGAYKCSTVIRVTDAEVTLFRPYVHTADFTTTAGVIPYIGTEEYSVSKRSVVRYVIVDFASFNYR